MAEVTFQYVEPEPIWIDFEGERFPIKGSLAFFYRLFRVMRCEEEARRELFPWLMTAKSNWLREIEKAAAAPAVAASTPYEGN